MDPVYAFVEKEGDIKLFSSLDAIMRHLSAICDTGIGIQNRRYTGPYKGISRDFFDSLLKLPGPIDFFEISADPKSLDWRFRVQLCAVTK